MDLNKKALEKAFSTMAGKELCRAIAEMAYTVALADNEVQKEEIEAFKRIIQTSLGEYAWIATSRFELLEKEKPEIEKIYYKTLYQIKRYRDNITPEIRDTFMLIIAHVAEAYEGTTQGEVFVINRLKEEVKQIIGY